jgi:hypothetical protein
MLGTNIIGHVLDIHPGFRLNINHVNTDRVYEHQVINKSNDVSE